ncbi:hypothetical protein EON63_06655 [archaeon]|nr:MAG: hypothetical protein EON63_06655 [archaeon]
MGYSENSCSEPDRVICVYMECVWNIIVLMVMRRLRIHIHTHIHTPIHIYPHIHRDHAHN